MVHSLVKWRRKDTLFSRPRPHVSGYFWILNFFSPDTASVHSYPMNPAYESATFWIRSPRWKFLNALWIRNPVDVKSGYFLSGDVTRSSPVLYREYCIHDGNFVPRFSLLPVFTTHALLPIFPEESWVLEWIRIRVGYVWTGKFDLKTDTWRRGNFWTGKEKVADSNSTDIRMRTFERRKKHS